MIGFIMFFLIIGSCDGGNRSVNAVSAANDRKTGYGSTAYKGTVGDMTGFGTG